MSSLEKNSTITTIYLQRNSIGDQGAKAGCFQSANTRALACAVPPRHWQQHLRRTVLSPPWFLSGIPSVTRVPRPGASRLQTLVHWHVMFSPRHWQQHLRRTELSPPSTLREIPSVTRVPRPGASRLQALVHWHVMFSPQALAAALEKNSTITTMDLAGNSIGHEGAKARCFQAPGTCALACDVFAPGTGSST